MDTCVHKLFETRALVAPQAQAVCGWDGRMSYQELNDAANRLARYLVANHDIKADDIIHVCFEKSIWYIVAVLAIMKAGAAFSPLDPSHPLQRKESIVGQTKTQLILSSQTHGSMCRELIDAVVEVTEDLNKRLEGRYSSTNLERNVHPEDSVYVLFTSGSTGTPKGLIMEHGAVCTSQIAIGQRLGISPRVRMLQFSSYVFDLSIGEIVCTLIGGGCVCVPSDEQRLTGLADFVKRESVSWAILTPAFARGLRPEDFPSLEVVILAGEASDKAVVAMWVDKVCLFNAYGPAETCVFSTIHQWRSKDESPTTLGRPVGAYCWVVRPDKPEELCPMGCVGELVIQGPTLLRRYLGDIKQNQTSFVQPAPPWAPNRQIRGWNRFYRTGDLAKFRSDKTVEFCSRRDTQVKIRGLRVELGEVEARIQKLMPKARHVFAEAVNLKTNSTEAGGNDSHTTLVTYLSFGETLTQRTLLTPDDIMTPMSAELRDRLLWLVGELKMSLPSYMVPTLLIPCHQLPVNSSTKVDRKILRTLTAQLSQKAVAEYALVNDIKRRPRTAMEEHMRTLWATLLRLKPESIGIDDSFLSIGGDSIIAIQLVAKARDAGIEVAVKDIFHDPRLHAVASSARRARGDLEQADIKPFELLDPHSRQAVEAEFVKLVSTETSGQLADRKQPHLENAFPVTPLQEGLMAMSVHQPRSYIAKWVYRLDDSVCTDRFVAAWDKTVQLCPSLRTRIIQAVDLTVQVHVSTDTQWESTTGVDMREYISRAKNIEMTYGSRLNRWALIQNENGSRHFFLVCHHAAYDGWTIRLIMGTLNSIYRQDDTLPTIRPFDGFIKHLQTADETATIDYWSSQLKEAKRATFPPKSAESRTSVVKTLSHLFTAPARSSSAGVTLATLVRAAWAYILAMYCETDDICFGTSVSGRQANVHGISDMPGPVVCTIPVRIQLRRDQHVGEYLQNVQRQAADMIPHEQYGLQNIAKLSAEAKDACDLTSLLVVQPFQRMEGFNESQPNSDAILHVESLEEKDSLGSLDNYFTFPLVMQASISDTEVQLHVTSDTNVVNEHQASALVHQFEHMILSLAREEQEDRPKALGALSAASPWDLEFARQQNSRIPAVIDTTFTEVFSRQAAVRPDTLVVRSREGELSYKQLDDLSNTLASHLITSGLVQKHDLVLVCFEKSLWYIVSIIAINKAGGAWVPLEPSYPLDRLQQVTRQSRAKLAIASSQHAQLCSSLVGNVITITPKFMKGLGPASAGALRKAMPSPSDIVYVLFTSGSTGTPKGLVMEHRAACTALTDIATRTDLSPGTNMLQFAAHVFDLGIGETLGALVGGATICIPSEHDRTNGITDFINEFGVTRLYLTPSFTRTFQPSDVPLVDVLLWAGEAVSQDLVQTWFGRVRRLFNGWGPAETCVVSTLHEWTSPDESPLTIGRPMGGFCWIVDPDDHSKLAPVGTVGEVVIQGPTVLREYLDDPDKTAKAVQRAADMDWAPSPSEHWGRAFKSGDLCSYNADGTIEFSRRKDTQIKIRGMRVELGEVEYHFRVQLGDDGAQVAADLLERDGSNAQLALFFTLDDYAGRTPSMADLFISLDEDVKTKLTTAVDNLRSTLPRYMIPTVFLLCHHLPMMTASTKLDRKALRKAVETLTPEEVSSFNLSDGGNSSQRGPQTKTEERLQKIWADVLNMPQNAVGMTSGFYHLGGDSIGIIKLVKRVEQEFQVKYHARLLGDSQSTIEAIARRIDGTDNDSLQSTFSVVREVESIMASLNQPLQELLRKPTHQTSSESERYNVLVTGGSGYLGAEIVRQLLEDPKIRSVIVHVRAKTTERGLARLKEAAQFAGWWSPKYLKKLEVWIGDLQKDQIGLSESQWARVCGRAAKGNINAIIHNGASVNWNLDYDSLRAINVASTMALLEAAMTSPVHAKFVFVSGGVSFAGHTDYLEKDIVDGIEAATGYVQTKHVCDVVIRNILDRLPTSQNRIAAVKPGRIIGSACSNSIANIDDYLWRLVAGVVSMGSYPVSEHDQWIMVADTNIIAKTIIDRIFAVSHQQHGAYKDMVVGMSTKRFWELVLASLGTSFPSMPWDDWAQEVKERLDTVGPKHPLFSVQDFMFSLGAPPPKAEINSSNDEISHYLEKAVTANVKYLDDLGYLQPTMEGYIPVEGRAVKRSAALEVQNKSRPQDKIQNIARWKCRKGQSNLRIQGY